MHARDDPQGMIFVSLLVAPSLMLAAVWAEQRRGASAGGWVAALPVSFPIGVVAVVLDGGDRVAAELAWSAGGHVAAQVIFGVCFAAALHRGSLWRGLACRLAAYGACSLVLGCAPAVVAAALAIPALLIGPRFVPAHGAPTPAPRPWTTTALTCLGASAVVAAAIFGSRLAGPDVGGALAAFPTMSTLLVVVAVSRGGAAPGVHALAGLVRSLPCYLTFCVLAALMLPLVGAAAVPLALIGCLAAGRVTWRALPAIAPSPSPA
jgi:hypothetical protein